METGFRTQRGGPQAGVPDEIPQKPRKRSREDLARVPRVASGNRTKIRLKGLCEERRSPRTNRAKQQSSWNTGEWIATALTDKRKPRPELAAEKCQQQDHGAVEPPAPPKGPHRNEKDRVPLKARMLLGIRLRWAERPLK